MGMVWVLCLGVLGGMLFGFLKDLWHMIFFRKEYLAVCKRCGLPIKALVTGWSFFRFGDMDIKTFYQEGKACCDNAAQDLMDGLEDIVRQEIGTSEEK